MKSKSEILQMLKKSPYRETAEETYSVMEQYFKTAAQNYEKLKNGKRKGVSTERWMNNSLEQVEKGTSQNLLEEMGVGRFSNLLEVSTAHVIEEDRLQLSNIVFEEKGTNPEVINAFQTDLYSEEDQRVKMELVATSLAESSEHPTLKEWNVIDHCATVDRTYNTQKIAHRVEKKLVQPTNALDQLIDTVATQVTTLVELKASHVAGEIGSKVGMWVGNYFGPVGIQVGKQVGYLLGVSVGQQAVNIINNGIQKIANLSKQWLSKLKPLEERVMNTNKIWN